MLMEEISWVLEGRRSVGSVGEEELTGDANFTWNQWRWVKVGVICFKGLVRMRTFSAVFWNNRVCLGFGSVPRTGLHCRWLVMKAYVRVLVMEFENDRVGSFWGGIMQIWWRSDMWMGGKGGVQDDGEIVTFWRLKNEAAFGLEENIPNLWKQCLRSHNYELFSCCWGRVGWIKSMILFPVEGWLEAQDEAECMLQRWDKDEYCRHNSGNLVHDEMGSWLVQLI